MENKIVVTIKTDSQKGSDGVYNDIEKILDIAKHYGHITEYTINTEKTDDTREDSL